MTEQEIRDFAEFLIKDEVLNIELITILELSEEWAEDDAPEISEEDARAVARMIHQAKVTVEFP